MSLKLQKRLSASLFKVGKNKIRFDESKLDEIKDAITKSDIRKLIGKKAIFVERKNEQSRYRARLNIIQKRKGRRKGIGSRKGRSTARMPSKKLWMTRIRIQRALLKKLRDKKLLTSKIYRELYNKAKGGFFRNKRHLKIYLQEHNIIKNGNK